MLGETLGQPLIFLFLIIFGFASGFVFDALNFVWNLCSKKKLLKHFLDFVGIVLVFIIFFLVVYFINFGEIRAYELVVFFIFFGLERLTLGKLVEKFLTWCYIIFTRFSNLVAKKLQRKKKDDKNSC